MPIVDRHASVRAPLLLDGRMMRWPDGALVCSGDLPEGCRITVELTTRTVVSVDSLCEQQAEGK